MRRRRAPWPIAARPRAAPHRRLGGPARGSGAPPTPCAHRPAPVGVARTSDHVARPGPRCGEARSPGAGWLPMRSTLGTPSDIEVDAGSTSILATNRRAPGWGSRSRVASAHVTALGDLDWDRIRELHDAELAWFRAERPKTLQLLARA